MGIAAAQVARNSKIHLVFFLYANRYGVLPSSLQAGPGKKEKPSSSSSSSSSSKGKEGKSRQSESEDKVMEAVVK